MATEQDNSSSQVQDQEGIRQGFQSPDHELWALRDHPLWALADGRRVILEFPTTDESPWPDSISTRQVVNAFATAEHIQRHFSGIEMAQALDGLEFTAGSERYLVRIRHFRLGSARAFFTDHLAGGNPELLIESLARSYPENRFYLSRGQDGDGIPLDAWFVCFLEPPGAYLPLLYLDHSPQEERPSARYWPVCLTAIDPEKELCPLCSSKDHPVGVCPRPVQVLSANPAVLGSNPLVGYAGQAL